MTRRCSTRKKPPCTMATCTESQLLNLRHLKVLRDTQGHQSCRGMLGAQAGVPQQAAAGRSRRRHREDALRASDLRRTPETRACCLRMPGGVGPSPVSEGTSLLPWHDVNRQRLDVDPAILADAVESSSLP